MSALMQTRMYDSALHKIQSATRTLQFSFSAHTYTQHLEALVEDYHDLSTYIDYLDVVEEQYNYTLSKKPTCGYCVRFLDLKRAAEKLLTSLEDTVSENYHITSR